MILRQVHDTNWKAKGEPERVFTVITILIYQTHANHSRQLNTVNINRGNQSLAMQAKETSGQSPSVLKTSEQLILVLLLHKQTRNNMLHIV